MYCPRCGSNNEDELKFCTRCGTNLGVVSDALTARTSSSLETDERMVRLLKDYYRSRRMTIIGAAASALALFKLAGPFILGFPEKMIPIVILSLAFLSLGLLAFVWGLVKWNNSSSEIKALGLFPLKANYPIAISDQSILKEEPARVAARPAPSTDPIALPPSITEHTTHFLDDDSPRST